MDLPLSLLEKRKPPLKTLFHPDASAKRVPWKRLTGNHKEELAIRDYWAVRVIFSLAEWNEISEKKSLFRKPRLHRQFLPRQLDAIFVAPKLQLQNRTCKPGAIFNAICRRDIAGVSKMFETCCNFSATKIASSCRDKNRLCRRAFTHRWGLGM